MSIATNISLQAKAVILSQLSTADSVAFIDVDVLRETEKAVLVEFRDSLGNTTGETEWLPKKALSAQRVLCEDVYNVVDWFSDHVDHGQLKQYFDDFGYKVEITQN